MDSIHLNYASGLFWQKFFENLLPPGRANWKYSPGAMCHNRRDCEYKGLGLLFGEQFWKHFCLGGVEGSYPERTTLYKCPANNESLARFPSSCFILFYSSERSAFRKSFPRVISQSPDREISKQNQLRLQRLDRANHEENGAEDCGFRKESRSLIK